MSGRTNDNSNTVFNLRPFFEKDRLNGENFTNWERMLRLILKSEGREDVIDTPLPILPENPTNAQRQRHKEVLDRVVPITCLMIAAMEPSLQARFENMDAYSIMQELRALFQKQARVSRYELHREILDAKMDEGTPVHDHVFRMMGLFDQMEKLGHPYSHEMATDIILRSLPESFNHFRMNYNMSGGASTLVELHSMLINAERQLPKQPKKEVLMVTKEKGGFKKAYKGKGKGKKDKGKGKQVAKAPEKQAKAPKPKAAAESECFYCRKVGHWKRNCPKYLEDKKNGASTSGIYIVT